MNSFGFYEEYDFKYPEIAICIEDTDEPFGKFFIPILTPCIGNREPYTKKVEGLDTSNIANDTKRFVTNINTSNYLDLPLPVGMSKAKKGDKFVVVFIGGDCNHPVLIGGAPDGVN